MLELIHNGAPNIVCTQPFACLPNHVVGKGVIKELLLLLCVHFLYCIFPRFNCAGCFDCVYRLI